MIPFIALWLAGFLAPAARIGAGPAGLVVATTRGETVVPVRTERGHATLPVPFLSQVLPLTAEVRAEWANVTFAGQPFRFLLDAPVFLHGAKVVPLAGGAYVASDTLFLPLQWLSGYIPQVLSEGYRYDPLAGRFEETAVSPVVTRAPAARPVAAMPRRAPARSSRMLPAGVLRLPHTVVVDAGHGGVDPGNPGLHLMGNLREKDVTLTISKFLRTELQRRGIEVIMTRTKDSLVELEDRGKFCRDECDLFLSIHVNSLPRRPGFESVSGVETYFLAEARTAEAQRVARMENEAVRYETGSDGAGGGGNELDFILKDLQTNEYLRESALVADLIEDRAGRVHPGGSNGVSQAAFVVLTTARRPAVLVEVGFSTNRIDGRFLSSAPGQQKVAAAIADAVVSYFQRYESKVATESEP